METIRKSDNHAVGYSLLSYLCGYYRYYYPEEYIAAYLATAANDEDIATGKKMAKRYGVCITRPKFRQDNRTYHIDKEKHEISDAIVSVKDIGIKDAEALLSLAGGEYPSFSDLLCAMAGCQNALNKTVIRVLILSDYFSEFGSAGKLLKVYQAFFYGENRVTKTLKPSTVAKRMAILRETERSMPEEEVDMMEMVPFEIEYYGSPLHTYPDRRGLYAVLVVDERYSPKITLCNLSSGKTGVMKMKKPAYRMKPINPGDIIRLQSWTKQPAYQYVDGKPAKKPGVFDLWIGEYEIL